MIELNIAGHQLAAVCLNPDASGEPTILLHGITSSISFWQVDPAAYLLEIGPCYALSLPGHYPARAPANFRRAPLTAETLVNLLDQAVRQLVGERPVTLIGHSTGGFAALALAANRPEMARRVVSISGFARGRWIGPLGLYQHVISLGWPGEVYFKFMYRLLMLHPAIFRWAMRVYTADVRAFYAFPGLPKFLEHNFRHFRQIDLDAMIPYFKHMPQIDITSQLERIQAQTLVITGDRDPIVPPSQADLIAKRVKSAELVVVSGAGHLPFAERAAIYDERLSNWLARTR